LVLIVTRPDTFRVERSATIAAPPAVVYGLIQDFHAWERWSPWAKLDPAMKTTYGGPAGVGATYAWEGNDQVGSGKMTIADLKPNENVAITLEFQKPMSATNRTEFALKPEGDTTKVTWRMLGHNDFMGKAFGLVMNMDQLVGKDFDKGLSQLRSAAEETARAAAEATNGGSADGADAGTP
jgi:uncharacterized protein YndB with AHSA1/START domain